MKISGCVFQQRNIKTKTDDTFEAYYKGKYIYVTSVHNPRHPVFDHLNKYDIFVKDIKTDLYDVDTYEYFHNIQDAIRYALKGACLIK